LSVRGNRLGDQSGGHFEIAGAESRYTGGMQIDRIARIAGWVGYPPACSAGSASGTALFAIHRPLFAPVMAYPGKGCIERRVR